MTNLLKFQVDVEKATPACSADCPNLNIEIKIKKSCYTVNGHEKFRMLRRIHCTNDEYCRRLYAVFDEKRSEEQ